MPSVKVVRIFSIAIVANNSGYLEELPKNQSMQSITINKTKFLKMLDRVLNNFISKFLMGRMEVTKISAALKY
jgi:hypothetical protein